MTTYGGKLVNSIVQGRNGHDLYKDGDEDAPECVKDMNGEVVLGLCRKCRRGEAELIEPCDWTQLKRSKAHG